MGSRELTAITPSVPRSAAAALPTGDGAEAGPRSALWPAAATARVQPRAPWLAALVGAAFFALYWRTLAPGVVGHDAGEFQFVPYILGIPHATGYPLQLLIGRLWSLLPLGSVAWRMNLLSAAAGAAAAAVTYLCGLELAGTAAGLLAALLVGLAPLEWTWSTMAGVRAPAMAFVAVVVLAALRWERAVRAQQFKPAERRLLLLAVLVGLALDHHRTIALLLPFLATYLLLVGRRPRPRPLLPDQADLPADRRASSPLRPTLLGKALGLALLPLLLYGVLPLRARFGAPWDQYRTGTWNGFWNLVLGNPDSAAHLDLSLAQALARRPLLLHGLMTALPAPALALAALGLVWLAVRRPAPALLLAGYVALLGFFTLQWDVGTQLNLVYFMPAYVPLALLASAGLAALAAVLYRLPLSRLLPWALVLAVAALGWNANLARFQPPRETLDDYRLNVQEGHQGMRLAGAFAALPPGATVVADWDQATVLWYAQFVNGSDRSAAISYPSSTLPSVLRRAAGPVFLASAAARPSTSNLSALGPFVHVLPRPNTSLPSGLVPVGCAFDGQVALAGIAPLIQPSYGVLPVTLYWQALRRPAADYAVSVRLMPSANRVAVQRDQAAPVLGLSPTSHWIAGQVTADYYELDLSGLTDGPYDLAVVMYQPLPNGYRNLTCGGSDRAVAGTLTLAHGSITFSAATRGAQPQLLH